MLEKHDKVLISRLMNSDRIAFKQLFDKYSVRIYYFTIRYLKNKEEAEEVTQDVFVRIWNKRFELKPELSFSSYLFTIAKNATIDTLRKRQKEFMFKEELSPVINSCDPDSHKQIEYKELKNIVKISIAALPVKRKQIYLMSRDEGLTYKQIAEKLNISIKTVESHMRLALQQLRKSIGSKYEFVIINIFILFF